MMSEEGPLVIALLITYNRTELAVRTIQGVKEKLIYPNLAWHIADDGSPPEHIAALKEAIGEDVTVTNAARKGVGKSMNLGMRECLTRADYILWLEDDWECTGLDLRYCVKILQENTELGMVRLGYLSPGLNGGLVSGVGRLWWRLVRSPGFHYTFTGHAALRHRRFCDAYGGYHEGITPGQEELFMCEQFNTKEGPDIVVPAWLGEWGAFGHIGGVSLNNMQPEG